VASELSAVLDELESWIGAERPDLVHRLRPGLSEAQIEDLEARVAPYRFPADVVTLYRWHDGWDDQSRDEPYVSLLPDCEFLALERAIDCYEVLLNLVGLPYAWNRLWLPAFGSQSGEFVELQPEGGLPAGPLWSFHSHDPEVHTSYDSVAALFRTALELWRMGRLPYTIESWPETYRYIAARNPVAMHPEGRSRLVRWSTPSLDQWPESWLAAANRGYPSPADNGDVISIAELVADPSCERPVRGGLRFAMEGSGWLLGTLTAGRESITVRLTRESIESFRQHLPACGVEMILKPAEDDAIEESMVPYEFGSDAEEELTRHYLEHSLGKFDAIHVVPLFEGDPRLDPLSA
jgi:hypothetical protein